jgi:hypothetical protein
MLATSYPLLDAFWTILEIFLFIVWFWLLIVIFSDIFRSRDLGGGAKALWVLFVIIIPFIGILVYLIARGNSMHERAMQQAEEREKMLRGYVQDAAGSASTADELAKLADLKNSGAITEEEFQAGKAKVLGGTPG